jgi:hypothetical protein
MLTQESSPNADNLSVARITGSHSRQVIKRVPRIKHRDAAFLPIISVWAPIFAFKSVYYLVRFPEH